MDCICAEVQPTLCRKDGGLAFSRCLRLMLSMSVYRIVLLKGRNYSQVPTIIIKSPLKLYFALRFV
jgi:hypothetical protein